MAKEKKSTINVEVSGFNYGEFAIVKVVEFDHFKMNLDTTQNH